MLIEAPAWFANEDADSPWRRLYWTLPLALLIFASALFLFSTLMERSAPSAPQLLPVDAQIVEMAGPAKAHAPAHREHRAPPAPSRPPAPPATPPSATPQPSTTPTPTHAAPAPATPPETAPASPQPAAPAVADHTAQALARPMPVIPDDLREDAMKATATARFHVASDGSVTVELIGPTQNPRLNHFLLEALSRWKFNPAIRDGKPVPSVEDMVIRVNVE